MTVAMPRDLVPHSMTFEEFLEWALMLEEDTRVELVEGKVEYMSPVTVAHQRLGRLLLNVLSFLVEKHQLGEVFYERLLMKVGASTGREPDILFLATANLHRLRNAYLDGPADLAIEIVSPGSGRQDRVTKRDEYERRGVPEYWVLDQAKTEALFYQLQANGAYKLVPADANGIYHSSVVPGLWINVNWLWQNPLPTQESIWQQWGLM